MIRSASYVSPWVPRALYVFALVLVAMPLLDFATSVMPARPRDFSWRYGAFGLMAGYLHTPMLGLLLGMAVAWALGQGWLLRIAGVLSMLAAVGLLGVMSVFALDVLQMRGMRAEDVQSAILAGGVLQELKYFTAAVVLALLGYGATKTAGAMKRSVSPRLGEAPGIVARGKATG